MSALARFAAPRRTDGTLGWLPRLLLLAIAVAGVVVAAEDVFTLLFYSSYVVVGLILAFRRPTNTVGWLLAAIGFGFLGTTTRPSVDLVAVQAGHPTLGDAIIVWIAGWIAPALFVGYASLAFVFPSGVLPRGRWRTPSKVTLATGAVILLLSMLQPVIQLSPDGASQIDVPNPLGILPGLPIWPFINPAGFAVSLGALAIGIASLIARYRAADDQTRLQVRWLLASMALVLFAIVAGLSITVVTGSDLGGLAWIPAIIAYPSVPLAVGIAILRYRLYEIDRIVNRALVYGAVTAILAGVFAAATTLSQRLFIAMTGESTDGAAVLTTLVVVALYAPVRKRVEAVVDRRFKYDEQYGPYLDELRRLLDLVDPQRAAARLAREARSQTGASAVAVTDASGRILATAGTWNGVVAATVPVEATGSPLGSVLVGHRSDHREIPAQRLQDLAAVASVVATALGGTPTASDGGSAAPPEPRIAEDVEPGFEAGVSGSVEAPAGP